MKQIPRQLDQQGTVQQTLPELVNNSSSEVKDVVSEVCVGDTARRAGRQCSLVPQQDVGSQHVIHQIIEQFSLVVVPI